MQKRNSISGSLRLAVLPLALVGLFNVAQAQAPAAAPALTADEKAAAKKIYFERCAGCHGVLRKGATGKNLEPHWSKKLPDGSTQEGGTLKLGTNRLEKIIGYGTEGGMVNFDDILTKEEISLMAKYIQTTPDGLHWGSGGEGRGVEDLSLACSVASAHTSTSSARAEGCVRWLPL